MKINVVSIKSQLKIFVSDFVKAEEMQCPHTEDALLDLVIRLSHYTEEGNSLFPQVLICEDLETSLKLIQGTDPLILGIERRQGCKVSQVLKRCAPLSQRGWITYIERAEDIFKYGVFRSSSTPTAVDIRKTISSLSEEEIEVPYIILASWLAERAVELVGSRSGYTHIYLSAKSENTSSPREALDSLAHAVCTSVPAELREQVENFIQVVLFDAMRQCHGTLVAILQSEAELPSDLTEDGVLLEQPINLTKLVQEYTSSKTDETLSALKTYAQLLIGMFSSDGIVVFDTSCKVWGYNFFIKKSNSIDSTSVVGGARRRAFVELQKLVDDGKIGCCFFQSNDGESEFYMGEN